MKQRGYERFGLVKNPFQDITSEQLEEVDLLHVSQPVDEVLQTIKDDVLDKRRKAAVVLVGPLGSGKTQRLMVAAREFEAAGGVYVYHQMNHEAKWIVEGVATAIKDALDLGAFTKYVSSPKWYRELAALPRKVRRRYDPEHVGKVLATALNERAPAVLLLNDIQNMEGQEEVDRFMQTMHAILNHIGPGVLVMMTSYPTFFQAVSQRHPAVIGRLDRRLPVQGLSGNEAALMLAKRFLANRLVDDLDPLYPFTTEAVHAMARASQNNPRRLLKLANRVLEAALASKAYHIDEETVARTLDGMGVPLADVPDARTAAGPETLAGGSMDTSPSPGGSGSGTDGTPELSRPGSRSGRPAAGIAMRGS